MPTAIAEFIAGLSTALDRETIAEVNVAIDSSTPEVTVNHRECSNRGRRSR